MAGETGQSALDSGVSQLEIWPWGSPLSQSHCSFHLAPSAWQQSKNSSAPLLPSHTSLWNKKWVHDCLTAASTLLHKTKSRAEKQLFWAGDFSPLFLCLPRPALPGFAPVLTLKPGLGQMQGIFPHYSTHPITRIPLILRRHRKQGKEGGSTLNVCIAASPRRISTSLNFSEIPTNRNQCLFMGILRTMESQYIGKW